MAHYIDAERLRALIETRYNTLKIGAHSPFRNGKTETLRETIDLINSLQQEHMEETFCPRSEKWKEVEETARHEYENGWKDCKEQMMKDYPKWRRIKAGERLPCPAYVWTIAYDNYPDCFEGRLMPNIQGVKVGRDTWYLPVDVIHNLPKED